MGDFDESLGAGSASGKLSAEETDYLIRAIWLGFDIYYLPDLRIFHRYPQPKCDQALVTRAYFYSVGFGSVLRKHGHPFPFVFYYWLRALGGAIGSLLKLDLPKTQYHLAVLKGRVLGWLG